MSDPEKTIIVRCNRCGWMHDYENFDALDNCEHCGANDAMMDLSAEIIIHQNNLKIDPEKA